MRIAIRQYDTLWPVAASNAMAELVSQLPGLFVHIEHIGSTAVPGLAAKPVIDLMASVRTLDGVLVCDSQLSSLGYERIATDMPNRLLYVRHQKGGRRSHHLHVVLEATWEARNERLLRDYLRTHPDDASRYAALKRQAAAAHRTPEDYTNAKTGLIQELTDRARAERGLPSVVVWEE